MGVSFYDEWEKPEYENLANIAENLVYRLPGCTDVMIRKTIASVYRDFCKRTCVIKTRRRICIEHGKHRYPLVAVVQDCVIDCICDITRENGAPFDGRGGEYSIEGSDTIMLPDRLLPNEGEKSLIEVTCIEIPKLSSERAPQLFIERYGDAIESGVLMKLMIMSGRPWSDPQQAAQEARAYENALTETRVRYHGGGNLTPGKLNFIKKGIIV